MTFARSRFVFPEYMIIKQVREKANKRRKHMPRGLENQNICQMARMAGKFKFVSFRFIIYLPPKGKYVPPCSATVTKMLTTRKLDNPAVIVI